MVNGGAMNDDADISDPKQWARRKRRRRWDGGHKYAGGHGHTLKYQSPYGNDAIGSMELVESNTPRGQLSRSFHPLPPDVTDAAPLKMPVRKSVTALDMSKSLATLNINKRNGWSDIVDLVDSVGRQGVTVAKPKSTDVAHIVVKFSLPIVGEVVERARKPRSSREEKRKVFMQSNVYFPTTRAFDVDNPLSMQLRVAFPKSPMLFSDVHDDTVRILPRRVSGEKRSNGPHNNVWSPPSNNKSSDFFEVDLGKDRTVAGFGTQGYCDTFILPNSDMLAGYSQRTGRLYNGPWVTFMRRPGRGSGCWVTRYEVQARAEGGSWMTVGIFKGNDNCFEEVSHSLANLTKGSGLVCRQLRFRPLEGAYHNSKMMKVNVYGLKADVHRDASSDVKHHSSKTYALHMRKENANPKLRHWDNKKSHHCNWSWSGPRCGVGSFRRQRRSDCAVASRERIFFREDTGLQTPAVHCSAHSGRVSLTI